MQLGNIDGSVSAQTLAKISMEYFEEFERRYGSHIHILDWALHLDEATPHIHERHVFDAVNRYGEVCPQQDKVLEELGFELDAKLDKLCERIDDRDSQRVSVKDKLTEMKMRAAEPPKQTAGLNRDVAL